MYEKVKQIVKKILPKSFLENQEQTIRKGLSIFYHGDKYQCNLCQQTFRKFIRLNSKDLLCPNCGSLPRTRGLWEIFQPHLSNKKVLHFSPTPTLKRAIQQITNKKNYITTDFENEFKADLTLNIEELDLESGSIDLIICYHVLEHVTKDIQALEEIHRVLTKGGVVYIQTPFKEGDIFEDYSIIEPADRLQQFGQEDHVRIYSPEGLFQRMTAVGLSTELIKNHHPVDNYLGLKEKEIMNVLIITSRI